MSIFRSNTLFLFLRYYSLLFLFIICPTTFLVAGGIAVGAEVEIVEIEEVEKEVAIETSVGIVIEKEVEMTVGEVEMIREGMGKEEEIEAATIGVKEEEKTVKTLATKKGKSIYYLFYN